MNPYVVVILVLGAGVVVLGICLFRSKTYYKGRLEVKDKAFDVLAKNSEVMMKDGVYLEGREKGIVIMALTAPQVKKRISEPKTRYVDREAYKTLLEKMKESIKQ